MNIRTISPQQAQTLGNSEAVFIDIRAADEYARARIGNARHCPVERLAADDSALQGAKVIVYYCKSGNRTRLSAAQLKVPEGTDAYILEGGLDAWSRAGLPVERSASAPLELSRQVQIVAGSLIVLGVVLGVWVSPWFLGLAGFVGAGLVFAGISGFCGMARLLLLMPWNRRALKARTA